MARWVKMSDLVTRCQQRAAMENETFVTGAEWKFYIHTAYSELYGDVVKTGLRQWEDTDVITTDGGATYALPDDYLATIGVDYVVGSQGERRALAELMAPERNVYRGIAGASEARAYALIGSGDAPLRLYPTPPTGKTYEHVYIPQSPDLTTAPDTKEIDMVSPDGENFVIWSVALMALAKEESDVTFAREERERLRASIMDWAQMRSFHGPRRIVVEDEPLEYGGIGEWSDRFRGGY